MKPFTLRIAGALFLVSFCNPALALQWPHLWKTADQQGYDLLQQGQFERAQTFQDKAWRATAAYKANNYLSAAQQFQASGTETSLYNQGNAFAKMGRYREALQAYDQALKINPKHADAIFNRKLVASLLKKNKEQNKEEKQQKNEQKKQQNNQQDQKSQEQDGKQGQEKKPEQKNKEDKTKQEEQDKQSKEDKQDEAKPVPQSASEREKQQEKEQWLRLIPDDPGGLLREKFLRDSIRRQRGEQQ